MVSANQQHLEAKGCSKMSLSLVTDERKSFSLQTIASTALNSGQRSGPGNLKLLRSIAKKENQDSIGPQVRLNDILNPTTFR